jgi:hypothetical protein
MHGASGMDGGAGRCRAHLVEVILDFLSRRLPRAPPATFSVVDARDVAEAMWLAALHGRRGER